MKSLCNALAALVLAASAPLHAAVMSIDLRGSGGFFDFDAPTGSRTLFYNAIQMDFQAVVGAPSGSGTLNATATSFGINASGSGDETSQIDGDAGVEELQISFTVLPSPLIRSAEFVGFTVNLLGGSDAGEYQANGGAWIPFTTSGAKVVANPAALDGYTLNIRHVSGNGFGVTSLEIDAVVLPEPTSVGLIAFALGGLRLFRRRR